MKTYVFDLDHTLLYKPYDTYDDIKQDLNLINFLSKIYSPKYLFTNATYGHADISLKKLNIFHYIDFIFARDTINLMKPDFNAYNHVHNRIKFNNVSYYNEYNTPDILFFDDQMDNLETAKKFNWTTIYIGNEVEHPDYIDYKFENIEQAIIFFVN
jgi:FMN phosphatase YigB (HAD superfamily)